MDLNLVITYEDGISAPKTQPDTEIQEQQAISSGTMQTKCPKCNQVFDTDLSAVGQWVTCPECGGEWCVLTLEEEQKTFCRRLRVHKIS